MAAGMVVPESYVCMSRGRCALVKQSKLLRSLVCRPVMSGLSAWRMPCCGSWSAVT